MPDVPEPTYIIQPEETNFMRVAATEYYSRGDFASMEGVLAGLAVVEPGDEWVFQNLGYARHRQGKLEAAVEAYERALALSEGRDTLSAVNLVGVYIMLGDADSAIARLRLVVESGDRRPEIATAVARLEEALGGPQN